MGGVANCTHMYRGMGVSMHIIMPVMLHEAGLRGVIMAKRGLRLECKQTSDVVAWL